MAEKMQITIIGLGIVGVSAGLALRHFSDKVQVVGHDKDNGIAGKAKSMGAVDRTEWNLVNAVRGADRILLAVPLSELHDTLEVIRQDLKSGCVIVDTAGVKSPVLAWAAELLPESASLVGGHPIVMPESHDLESARADLFQGKIFCLTADPRTPSAALQMATDLVEALGAKPLFIDPVEHDGMAAAVEHLPAILAAALARSTSESSSWKEMRKMAAGQFYAGSFLVENDAKGQTEACLANRQNTLRWIDNLMAELGQWRARLEAEDREGLTQAFEQAISATEQWFRAQQTGQWEETPTTFEYPSMGSQVRRMFGFGSRDLRDQAKGNSKKGR